MGLFSKKPPCPICGGKISWFLPTKIEGEYICDTCYGKIDMDSDKESKLTLQSFRDYLAFYEQNRLLKERFVISEQIDFGLWDTKIIFDYQNRLFCLSKQPDKTVFEAGQLKSFTIKEDNAPLYEGSAAGIHRYASTVPERAMAMTPLIAQFVTNSRMARTLDRLDDGKTNNSVPMQFFNAPKPFKAFNVELHLDHPYWTLIKSDMDGPQFDSTHPDVDNYLRDYRRSIEEIEKLVSALVTVAFPGATEQYVAPGGVPGVQSAQGAFASPTDPIEEIRKYKALMEGGIISSEEFDAKKRQLLGI